MLSKFLYISVQAHESGLEILKVGENNHFIIIVSSGYVIYKMTDYLNLSYDKI